MTAVFVMLPFTSHFLATFGFARMWQERGYRTIFTGQASHRYLVETEGFEFYELEYTIIYTVKSFRVLMGFLLKSMLNTNDLRARYRSWYNSVLSYRSFIKASNPNVIFLDDHLGYYSLYLLPTKIPTVIVNTKLSTARRVNVPPLNSELIPNFTFFSKIQCWLLWEKHLAKRQWIDWLSRCAFLGKNDDYFQEHLTRRLNLNSYCYLDNGNSFYKGLRNVPVVLLAPESLEYKQYSKFSNEIYINPPFTRQETAYKSNTYISLKRELQINQKTGQIRVIYAAFGTLMSENVNTINKFLPKLLKALSGRHNWVLILSASENQHHLCLNTVPNVFIMPFIPQLDILTWCDAIITHGGLTTIKECLQNGVPMLIYPINKRMDMVGNGARVVNNKWGLMGEMEIDSSTQIAQKLAKVLELKIAPHQPDIYLPSALLNILKLH